MESDLKIPSREIYWNVGTGLTPILMYLTMTIALVVLANGLWRRWALIASGQPAPEFLGNWLSRFQHAFVWAVFQKGVIKKRFVAWLHTLIYFGFLVLLFTTTMVLIHHDLGIQIYQGNFYLVVTFFSDIFGFGILIGCVMAIIRRYLKKPDLIHNRLADNLMLIFLVVLIFQGFLLEGLRIQATNDPWRSYSPIGDLFALSLSSLSEPIIRSLHTFIWWFHTLTVFTWLALIPYTKFYHLISSPLNLFFRNSARPKGALPHPGDLEKMMEDADNFKIGLGNIKDYSWKQLLELDACTSCGRCQDACPAYNSGKSLSPKWLILDSRNHALSLQAQGKLTPSKLPQALQKMDNFLLNALYLKSSGFDQKTNGYEASGTFRANNELTQKSALKLGDNVDDRIAGDVIDPNVFWSCTTCMACVEACPVGINHVEQIVGNRRNMALMQGEIPAEAQKTLRALENRQNPYGPQEDRIKWLKDMQVKILNPGDEVEYLYWVGCVTAFDARKQKIAQAVVTLMQRAGLSFGILGTAEGCTGDPARRLGEENLFQTLAKMNIETLKSVKFKYLVANCPHCFNTIKNEYPQIGNLGEGQQPEIIHHSRLIRQLIKQGKFTFKEANATFTFHDPCYLGRYNREFEAPREAVQAVPGIQLVEMEKSREDGYCCGAGGGHFWMDLKVGERVNVQRVTQAKETKAEHIATGCPFCMHMLEDGLKLTGNEEMKVKDISEIVLDNLS